MHVNLHKNARTTPAIRRELRESTLPIAELARRSNLSKPTMRKRRGRADRFHCPHRLQTTLSAPQEAIAVALRRSLLLPLDDLLAVVRQFVCEGVSRSGLDRCPQRALGHISPVEALQQWYRKKPELFVSEVNNLTGLDIPTNPRHWISSMVTAATGFSGTQRW